MKWRIRFDEPISLATEPGFFRTLQSADYAPPKDAFSNTWRDSVTRTVMLRPSWLKRDYYTGLQPLPNWFHGVAWAEVQRSKDQSASLRMMSTVQDDAWTPADVNLGLPIGLPIDDASTPVEDNLVWALASGFLLAGDEGFVVHYHTSDDELKRKNNWLAFQWDNILLHISGQGQCRVYRYADRNNLAATPDLWYEFEFSVAGENLHHHGYFVLQPVPQIGLAVYFRNEAPRKKQTPSNAGQGISRGHLVPWTSTLIGTWRMFEASALRIAINPYQAHVLGVQLVRFPASGTFIDAPFDPQFRAATNPYAVEAIPLNTVQQSITASLRNLDDSAPWTAGTNRQARVKQTLATSDNRYTPFSFGYSVSWVPTFATRATTPYTPSKVTSVEYSRDEFGRWEGRCECLMEGAAGRAIAERGDATFVLENSPDGAAWTAVWGGFAVDWDLQAEQDFVGFYYRATCSLRDMWHRFGEVHQNQQTAFDGLKLGDAINLALRGGGFQPIASLPSALQAIEIPRPTAGQSWRYAPQQGDDGQKVIEALLMLARSQYVQWRLTFDWATFAWVLEKRTRVTDGSTRWDLQLLSSQENLATRNIRYSELNLKPEEPEGNIVVVVGVSQDDTQGSRIVSPVLYNQDSLTNTASVDYLGRAKILLGTLGEAATQGEVNLMALRVYDAAAHRRVIGRLETPKYSALLKPDTPVRVIRDGAAVLMEMWVKRQTVHFDQNEDERMTLELDSQWESEMTA